MFFRTYSAHLHVHDPAPLYLQSERPARQLRWNGSDASCCRRIQNKTRLNGDGLLADCTQLHSQRLLASQIYFHHVGLQEIRLLPGNYFAIFFSYQTFFNP